ncbi:MAG: Jag N-terminal domain-containing protein [Sulfurovum sp.]|nr:Jag N-terminal domain-containing protein [Sulfurovum sp.]
MKKVEAQTLEEAYTKASKVLECSISELHYEVVQYPSKGILGFLKKNAIIMAKCKNENIHLSEVKSEEEDIATEILSVVKEEYASEVVEYPFQEDEESFEEENIVYDELALLIENQLKVLFSHSCFDIDVIEVDVRDNTALIFIDGEDAALLIGKEGYRYNALSYMIFSWLHTKYELFIKLEIAEFITKQQEMIRSYIKPVIETVENTGRAKTRFLDGILVQIALEQLREKFPNKYVAVKTTKDGKKFVVINDFNNKNNG